MNTTSGVIHYPAGPATTSAPGARRTPRGAGSGHVLRCSHRPCWPPSRACWPWPPARAWLAPMLRAQAACICDLRCTPAGRRAGAAHAPRQGDGARTATDPLAPLHVGHGGLRRATRSGSRKRRRLRHVHALLGGVRGHGHRHQPGRGGGGARVPRRPEKYICADLTDPGSLPPADIGVVLRGPGTPRARRRRASRPSDSPGSCCRSRTRCSAALTSNPTTSMTSPWLL
jgi:hypothetical protein